MVAGVLCARPVAAIPQGQEHVPLAVEHHPAAEVAASPRLGQRPEQDLDIRKAVAVEPAAGQLGAVAPGPLAGIGDIDEAVLREPGVQHDVVQTALPPRRNRAWKSRYGSGIQRTVGTDVAEPACPLGDQHPSIRKEGQRPRALETAGQNADAYGVSFGLLDSVRRCEPRPAKDDDESASGDAVRQTVEP